MTTPTKTTPALHAYLTDWLAWVDRGAPDREPYWRNVGLCTNLGGSIRTWRGLREALDFQLYPFGGHDDYWNRHRDNTQHLNEARLAWVRSTLATAEIEG